MDIFGVEFQFVCDWEDGLCPTLEEYVTRYPQWAEELTDFILTFGMMNLFVEEPDSDKAYEPDTALIQRALIRAYNKIGKPPPSWTLDKP